MTPEEWLGKKVKASVIIFDEFHLYYYWGDSFRPLMWEAFYEISLHSSLSIALTATLSEVMQFEISHFGSNFNSIFWVDYGNQGLKFKPNKYIKAPSKEWLMKQITSESKDDGVKLIFCPFREQVIELEKKLSGIGFDCLSCVGGEGSMMIQKLSINPDPDFIICTTVLSHGVNLPSLKKIYFLYAVNNLDFWIQMIARGGRRGEPYEVFSLENPHDLDWNRWQNSFEVLKLSVRKYFSRQPLLNQLFISK